MEAVDGTSQATVWCIPRIKPRPSKAQHGPGKTTGEAVSTVANTEPLAPSRREQLRPPRVLVSEELLVEAYGRRAVIKEGSGFVFKGNSYVNGLVRLVVPLANLKQAYVFSYTLYRVCAAAAHIPTQCVEGYVNVIACQTLRIGDRVTIFRGEQAGSIAHIINIDDDRAEVKLRHFDLAAQVPLRDLRRAFVTGDSVLVAAGVNARRWGYVVEDIQGLLTIASPDGQQSVRPER